MSKTLGSIKKSDPETYSKIEKMAADTGIKINNAMTLEAFKTDYYNIVSSRNKIAENIANAANRMK